MVGADKIQRVEDLLAADRYSYRTIALLVGVSRSIVSEVANGERRARMAAKQAIDEAPRMLLGPVERCPGCGQRAFMPCMLCAVRAEKSRDREKQLSRYRAARSRGLSVAEASRQMSPRAQNQPSSLLSRCALLAVDGYANI